MQRLARTNPTSLRLAAALGAAVAGGAAYVCAPSLAGDLRLAGLADEQVRILGHFTGYGTMAVLLALMLGGRFRLAWLTLATVAAADEVHQLHVAGRVADFGDWMLDAAGITCFLLVAAAVSRRLATLRRDAPPSAAA